MARKVFQHFAHVLCQRFIEVPSNKDLASLVLFGTGTLVLDLTAQRATWNRHPVDPLPYAEEARRWLYDQMEQRKIPVEQLVSASLVVEYVVELTRKLNYPFPIAGFDFSCTGSIVSPDRQYTSAQKARKVWGLMSPNS
jgi:hypothetical protein